MNIFYAPPSQIKQGVAELIGQEARHAAKVMRARIGDQLTIVDGKGGKYKGVIQQITEKRLQLDIENKSQLSSPVPEIILGMGIIKKRDRLEFAVEKAVELGAQQICLFRSEHSVKQNVRMDRLESSALAAMKQSLRAWLPDISFYYSFYELLRAYPDTMCLAAHEKVDVHHTDIPKKLKEQQQLMLLVGPEGGFSEGEMEQVKERNGELISLGEYRLRTETAVVVFLSQFINT